MNWIKVEHYLYLNFGAKNMNFFVRFTKRGEFWYKSAVDYPIFGKSKMARNSNIARFARNADIDISWKTWWNAHFYRFSDNDESEVTFVMQRDHPPIQCKTCQGSFTLKMMVKNQDDAIIHEYVVVN